MDKTERVQQLCSQHSKELRGLALDVCSHGRWDMNLPVAVIDARKTPHRFHISAVGTIGNILRVSTTADHPLMQQLFELYESQGSDAALAHMLSDAESGDEFAQLFETHKEERRLGSPLWSASDAASFVVKSSATMYSMVIKSLFNSFCQPAQEISTAEAMNYPTAGKRTSPQ